MEARQSGLIVRSEGRNIEVSNGPLLVRFVYRDGGYAQEIYATNAKGQYRLVLSSLHKDIIPASEHRVGDSPVVSGARPHLFAVCRESLRMVFSEAQVNRPDQESVVIRLSGSMQGNAFAMRLTIKQDSSVISCEVDNALAGSRPAVEYLMSSYAFLPGGRAFAFGEEPEFTWAPNLRPTNDAVIGDAAFFSPAAIVQHGRYAAALLPDVETLSKNRPMPASLDLDLTNGLLFAPLLSYGFCDYEPAAGGSYFQHDITHSRRLDTGRLTYGFDLMIDADCKRDSMARQVTRYLWSRYGSGDRRKPAVHAESRPRAMTPGASAAYALWAKGLIDEARALRDSVLSSPARHGLFATHFDRGIGFWRGCNLPDGSDYYSTAECSREMLWLLRMHKDFEPHPTVLQRAREYADFLIDSKMRSGAIPAWYDMRLLPEPALRSGAPTAASAIFLIAMARVSGLKKHMQAAASAARFVMQEVVSHRLFFDETCVSPAGAVSLECADPHTGMQQESTRAMLWCAQMCIDAYELFGDRIYLTTGINVLDRLCLMQSLGDKPWMPGTAGMLARGNTCAGPDAPLTADFAYCAMKYGVAVGAAEYCDRAALALRAAVTSGAERAHVEAVAALMEKEFGTVYISVAGKWSIELNGCRIDDLNISGTAISVKTTQGPHPARIVFSAMRARHYEVSINGRRRSYCREEMEAGIKVTP